MILIFDARNLCTDICKTIFVILEVQFHHKGGLRPSRRSLFWTFVFISGSPPLNHHAKFCLPRSPSYTFLSEFPKCWQILCSKSFFLGAKYGTYPYKLCCFFMGFKVRKKWTSALVLFLCFKTFFKIRYLYFYY